MEEGCYIRCNVHVGLPIESLNLTTSANCARKNSCKEAGIGIIIFIYFCPKVRRHHAVREHLASRENTWDIKKRLTLAVGKHRQGLAVFSSRASALAFFCLFSL